jgi:hypothetical protein
MPGKKSVNKTITQLFQGLGSFCLLGSFGPIIASWFLEQNAPGCQNDVGPLE